MASQQDRKLTELIKSAIADGRALAQHQVDLTRAEVAESGKHAASSGGMFVGALFLGHLGFVFLLVAAAYGIVAAGLPTWAGFLIVAAALLLITLIMGLIGRSQARLVGPPERSKAALEETKAALARTEP